MRMGMSPGEPITVGEPSNARPPATGDQPGRPFAGRWGFISPSTAPARKVFPTTGPPPGPAGPLLRAATSGPGLRAARDSGGRCPALIEAAAGNERFGRGP